jgi:hypothetical protein
VHPHFLAEVEDGGSLDPCGILQIQHQLSEPNAPRFILARTGFEFEAIEPCAAGTLEHAYKIEVAVPCHMVQSQETALPDTSQDERRVGYANVRIEEAGPCRTGLLRRLSHRICN